MAITLNDMIKCGQGDIIVSMMIDAKAFFDYDQRENGNTLEVYDDYWLIHKPFKEIISFSNKNNDIWLFIIFCLSKFIKLISLKTIYIWVSKIVSKYFFKIKKFQ